jgi:hypothetical protein
MEEDKMGGTRSMRERDEKCIQNFSSKTWNEEASWKT